LYTLENTEMNEVLLSVSERCIYYCEVIFHCS